MKQYYHHFENLHWSQDTSTDHWTEIFEEKNIDNENFQPLITREDNPLRSSY